MSRRHEGGCACGAVRYSFSVKPMITNCCHCSLCQRQTGSAFVINAIIETSALMVTGETATIETPSPSGKGQKIVRCATCHVALWSHYGGAGPALAFVRVGTLDNPTAIQPDVHIFTSTKQPWVRLPEGVRTFEGYYNAREVWSDDALARAIKAKES